MTCATALRAWSVSRTPKLKRNNLINTQVHGRSTSLPLTWENYNKWLWIIKFPRWNKNLVTYQLLRSCHSPVVFSPRKARGHDFLRLQLLLCLVERRALKWFIKSVTRVFYESVVKPLHSLNGHLLILFLPRSPISWATPTIPPIWYWSSVLNSAKLEGICSEVRVKKNINTAIPMQPIGTSSKIIFDCFQYRSGICASSSQNQVIHFFVVI